MAAHKRPLLGHISLGARSYAASKKFYTAALAPLGLHLVYDSGPDASRPTLGYGPDARHETLNIFVHGDEARAPGPGMHIAFNATSCQAVRDFYKEALASGGVGDGEPGMRKQYGEGYFAAFVACPDGWRIEAVCKDEEEGEEEEGESGRAREAVSERARARERIIDILRE